MLQYPIDLALFEPTPAEEFSDAYPINEAFEHDPKDGRKELRRQASLREVGVDPDEAEYVLNPATTIAVAAAFLGISERHYHRLVDAGILPRFPKGEVDLAIVETDFERHLGLAATVLNLRTGKAYSYGSRKKVW